MTKIVRALHGATTIGAASAPYDTAHFRINYPALWTGSDTERLTGVLPADTELAPWPLAIMLPGINVGSDGYRWIAISLAQAGIATLTYDLVAEVMPGSVALSPGLDISAVMPGEYGRRPSATALAPLLAAVREANTSGPLAGMIDTNRVMLIGHSAGGTVALENASREWVPGLRGVAVYGAHTMPAVMLGHPHGTVLPLPDDVPALVMSGTDDGVIRSSADRYQPTDDHDPVRRTFRESCTHHMSRLVVIDGGTHMVMCHNDDSTTARGFLDDAPTTESLRRDGEVRCLMSGLLIAFAHAVFADATDTTELDRFATHRGVAGWEAHP